MRARVAKSGRSFGIEPGQSVLDAALRAGLNLPHSCKSGNCGSCRARLLEGEVRYPNGSPLGLSEAERADGLVLLCQARAATDLILETSSRLPPDEVLVKRLPSRIERIEQLAPDVIAVYLRLPAAERFDFQPGQYVDVLLSKGRRRSFSIASPPHDSRLLELHVRLAPGGEFTGPLFAGRMAGALLDIEGPLGHFIYREPAAGGDARTHAPGGGRHRIGAADEHPAPRDGGGRGARHDALLGGAHRARSVCARGSRAPRRRYRGLRYVPVLSEPSPAGGAARGLVHEAVLADARSISTATRCMRAGRRR